MTFFHRVQVCHQRPMTFFPPRLGLSPKAQPPDRLAAPVLRLAERPAVALYSAGHRPAPHGLRRSRAR